MAQFNLKKYLIERARTSLNEEHKFSPPRPIYKDDGSPAGGVMHPATLVGGPKNGMQFGTAVYGDKQKNKGGMSYSDTEHYYIDPKKPQNEKRTLRVSSFKNQT